MRNRSRSGGVHLLGLAIILISVSSTVALATETVLRVTAQSAGIRSTTDSASATRVTVPAGTLLSATSKEGRWYRVALLPDGSGRTFYGYVHELLVTVVGTDAAKAEPATERAPDPVRQPAVEPVRERQDERVQEPPHGTRPAAQTGAGAGPKSLQFRPYARVGALLKGSTAAELDFSQVGGGSLEQFLTLNKGAAVAGCSSCSGRERAA